MDLMRGRALFRGSAHMPSPHEIIDEPPDTLKLSLGLTLGGPSTLELRRPAMVSPAGGEDDSPKLEDGARSPQGEKAPNISVQPTPSFRKEDLNGSAKPSSFTPWSPTGAGQRNGPSPAAPPVKDEAAAEPASGPNDPLKCLGKRIAEDFPAEGSGTDTAPAGMAVVPRPPGNGGSADGPLRDADPEVWELVQREQERQLGGIELIASENFVCQAVLEALGTPTCNKYSEGLPGARYYGCNQHIDTLEKVCRERALRAFSLDPEEWGVNVQPYSCTSANLAVFAGLLTPPKDRIMGLDLPSGGHMSHGYITTSGKRVAAASVFFDTLPYKVNPGTGLVDYDKMEERAMEYRPKLLICGGSSYARGWDFARCRQIADRCGAVLMCDMAHIAGLVAAGEHPSPFEYADIVTSTTHKTMRGPRGGIIFYRRGPVVVHHQPRRPTVNGDRRAASPAPAVTAVYDYEDRINFGLFPMVQGGPHNNHTAALAVALKQVASPAYHEYMRQVKRNAAALAAALMQRGCSLVTGGTDNHQMLWDLRPLGLTGQRFEKVCELCGISLNKCPIYGDTSSPPGGVRIGTPALTTRGCKEENMEVVADLLVRAAQIAQKALLEQQQQQQQQQILSSPHVKQEPGSSNSPPHQGSTGPATADTAPLPPQSRHKRPRLSDWVDQLAKSEEVKELSQAVHDFASSLPMPGFGGIRP